MTGQQYTASAEVRWDPTGLETVRASVPNSPDALDRQVADQREVVLSDQVVNSAADELGMDPEEVRDIVEVGTQAGSSVLTISATDDDARQAAAVSAAMTTAYVDSARSSSAGVLADQATVLQGSIDRLQDEAAALNDELARVNADLATIPTASPAYGATQNRATQTSNRLADVAARLSDLTGQQDTFRASADLYTGPASVLREAETPDNPSSLSVPTAAVLGAALGLLLGLCAVFFLSRRWNAPAEGGRPTAGA
ncbi:hypothetical protein [Blastococcus sp. TF02A-26]|uniref:hypothetical protein n=1 Tax=Blastococcus sp. TF02A-26 TaxID=2250577 RepID=UPI0011BDDA1F|nr:hypothetical protein [Blastococcus sp. TF02A-26]